jgi:hypothetical protein
MPPPIPLWQDKLAEMDLPLAQQPWGYFVPEAALVFGSENLQRRERHVRNWLKIRHAWFYTLRNEQLRCTLPARWWRAYLDYGPSASVTAGRHDSKDYQKAMEKINSMFDLTDSHIADGLLYWAGTEVTAIDLPLCQQVAWELCEIQFRVELLTLDNKISLSEDSPELSLFKVERLQLMHAMFNNGFQIDTLEVPSENIGLASNDSVVRAKHLEAFRRLMSSWPNFPPCLSSSAALRSGLDSTSIQRMESRLVEFYSDTFIRHAGRPPVLPRRTPMST